MNRVLARKINFLALKDQRMRKKAVKSGIWDKNLDRQNTEELKKIIRKYGWPTIGLVGSKASFNAWLLAQHADHDMKFQKRTLELMEKAYKNNPRNIEKKNIAYLTDRVLIHEGKKQMFGTQFYRNKKGRLNPRPIQDRNNLNKRRKEYNLTSFREYLKLMTKRGKILRRK